MSSRALHGRGEHRSSAAGLEIPVRGAFLFPRFGVLRLVSDLDAVSAATALGTAAGQNSREPVFRYLGKIRDQSHAITALGRFSEVKVSGWD